MSFPAYLDETPATGGAIGMSTDSMPNVVVDAPPQKRRRRAGLTTEKSGVLEIVTEGENGYVCTVGYEDGTVTFESHIIPDSEYVNVSEWSVKGTMSVKDWKHFRHVVCVGMYQQDMAELGYMDQWDSVTGPKTHHVVASPFRQEDDFVFLSVCEDRERMTAVCGEARQAMHPSTDVDFDFWFKIVFFIQWCDWAAMQKVFRKIDQAITRDRVNS
ncbi:hypothetical protein VZT92_014585 [Zoarces viviparus]|uniref:Uncharacterized protein n=1 Tax=Zoarces viviparus TaxID=48416 RepID=A0AAW1F0H2_ZOAVI